MPTIWTITKDNTEIATGVTETRIDTASAVGRELRAAVAACASDDHPRFTVTVDGDAAAVLQLSATEDGDRTATVDHINRIETALAT